MTVPNQSMSLQEIVKRFIRRESLPVEHNGVYEERFGDLEKLSAADIFDQMERVTELKAQIDEFKKAQTEKAAAAKAIQDAKDKEEKEFQDFMRSEYAARKAQSLSPGGVKPVSSPPLQGS